MFNWLYNLTKISKTKGPASRVRVFFDIDETLFVAIVEGMQIEQYEQKKHLTKIQLGSGETLFMIYLQKTKSLFKELLQIQGVEIGFITAADYRKSDIISIVETIYELPKGCFNKSIYINRNKYGVIPKGIILDKLRKCHLIAKHDHVILVDDNLKNIYSAKELGFTAIHATGCIQEFYQPKSDAEIETIIYAESSRYLEEVIKIVRAKVLSPIQSVKPYVF